MMLFNNKLLVAVLTMATMVTYPQAQDLLKTDPEVIKLCDFNGNGKIDTGKDYRAGLVSKEIVKKERTCKLDQENKKLDEDIKKLDEDNKKLDEDIKKLDEDNKKLQKIKKILSNN